MNKIKAMVLHLLQGISRATVRFPLTTICLITAAVLVCYTIALPQSPPLVIEKLVYTCLVGAVLGMTAQFAAERFVRLAALRPWVYGVSALLTIGYFFILWPTPEISSEISIRTFVAVAALLCAVFWIPAYQRHADFNEVCLVHFKSAFTSILYSAVLAGGLAAILAAIDILLFRINYDAYSYMMSIVWILFAPIYYLSLLPRFNSRNDSDAAVMAQARHYPKFLEILVSYIAIPLITAYTLVLLAYFIKILVTWHWPSGQLGPMVLIYSAAGLIIYVLASLLQNRFAALYVKIFPKVLIPVVILQLISVGIRLNAYGITESRYYVALFGLYSVVVGILLSLKPVKLNSMIALLAAALAIVSIIPPVDAFTVSRSSQIHRLEQILISDQILSGGKISANPSAQEKTKIETTNILNYLDMHHSLKYIAWLPEDFELYRDSKNTFGFEPTYPSVVGNDNRYFAASLDSQQPMSISDYDIAVNINSYRYPGNEVSRDYDFSIDGNDYVLAVNRLSNQDVRISVQDTEGRELIGTGLYGFVLELEEKGGAPKEALPPDKMTLDVTENGYKLKIILRSVNVTFGSGPDTGADYDALVLFGVPARP